MAAIGRRIIPAVLLLGVVSISGEATARIDDRIRFGVPLTAAPNEEHDLTITDSLGRRGRPYGRFKHWHLNRFGFRSPAMTVAPPAGCTRVMVLGASESFGLYESPGEEYPAQLQALLSKYGCYEVVNAALPGLTVPAITALWNNWASHFGARIVLVYASPAFYLGDRPPQYPRTRRTVGHDAPAWWHPRLLDRAVDAFEVPAPIQQWRVERALANIEAAHPPEWYFRTTPRARLRLFSRHLDSLITAIRNDGAEPVLITHAMRFTAPPRPGDVALLDAWRQFSPRATRHTLLSFEVAAARAVTRLGAERHVTVVDAAAAMDGHQAWFADFVHFTDSGATVMANLIAEQLRPPFRIPEAVGALPPLASGTGDLSVDASSNHATLGVDRH